MIAFDYQSRMNALRKEMEIQKVDAVIFPTDANMEYFTSVPRIESWTTKQRQNSSDYSCVLVTESETVIFLPCLSYIVTTAKLGENCPNVRFVVFSDGDLTGKALSEEFQRQKLFQKTIGAAMELSVSLLLRISSYCQNHLVDMTPSLKKIRSIKDEAEIACIREATERTDAVYRDLLNSIHIGARVEELEAELEYLMLKHGGTGSSFRGELNNHGPKSGNMVGESYPIIEKGYVLGLDFGMFYQGYCTDFGRTVFIGEPDREVQKMYETVVSAQNAAIVSLSEKSSCQAADESARTVISRQGYAERFIHKLGHGIGLDVHEEPFLCKGEELAVQSGMLFAVEPSIFIPHRCFVRVEDIVEVTDCSACSMSKISREICVVE